MDNKEIIVVEEKNKNNNKNNKNNKFICEVCGNTLYKSNKKRHERTIKHNEIKYIYGRSVLRSFVKFI